MSKHLQPANLERYSFIWSEARLIIAAIALFLGGVPPLLALFPGGEAYATVWPILKISWIISGVASAYLLYRWFDRKTLFGRNDLWDKIAFFVSTVSGINLGLTGLMGKNIGMSLVEGKSEMIFVLTGIVYIITAVYLLQRWKASGRSLFH